MNKTLEKILEDELFVNEVFEGERNLQIKNTSEGTKMPTTLIGNTIQDGEPSPEKPVELRHLADDINIFDEEWGNSSTTSTSKNFIPVFKDEYYIYSQNNEGSAVNYNFYETKESTVQSIYADANTGFTPPSNGFAKLSKRLIPEGTKCKLQKGKKGDITPYSSYGKGTVEIRNHGKNFIDINEFQSGHIISRDNKSITGNFTGNFQSGGRVNISLSNKKYLASIDISPSSTARLEINLMKNGEDKVIKITQHTYLIDNSNGEYDGVGITLSNGTYIGEVTFKNPQLEIVEDNNTIPTEYETYVGEDTVIQTAPLRSLSNGVCDEKDGNKTIRRVGEVILDGTENWKAYQMYLYLYIEDCVLSIANNEQKPELLCSHFKAMSINEMFVNPNAGISNNIIGDRDVQRGIAFVKNEYFDSVEALKEYLFQQKEQGTPVTIYYELAEPEIEEANENKLANLTAYDGETNIFCASEIPCGLKVDAKISKIKKLEEQINAQGGV